MTHENVEVAQANNAKPEVAENATKAVVEGKEAALKIEKLNGMELPDAAGEKVADAVEANGHITPSDAPVSVEHFPRNHFVSDRSIWFFSLRRQS